MLFDKYTSYTYVRHKWLFSRVRGTRYFFVSVPTSTYLRTIHLKGFLHFSKKISDLYKGITPCGVIAPSVNAAM